jgi:hypothetical protein
VANGFLPAGQRRPSPAFFAWRAFARYSPVLPAGLLVAAGTVRRVPPKVRAGYDAPFPDKTYQAGARAFPQLVPTSPLIRRSRPIGKLGTRWATGKSPLWPPSALTTPSSDKRTAP